MHRIPRQLWQAAEKPSGPGRRAQVESLPALLQDLAAPLDLPVVTAPALAAMTVTLAPPPPLLEADLYRKVGEWARGLAVVRPRTTGERVGPSDEVCVDLLGYAQGKLVPGAVRLSQWVPLPSPGGLPFLPQALEGRAVGDGLAFVAVLPADHPVESLRGMPVRYLLDVREARKVELPAFDTEASLAALFFRRQRVRDQAVEGELTGERVLSVARAELEEERAGLQRMEAQELALDLLLSRAGKVEVPAALLDEVLRRRWAEQEGVELQRKGFGAAELEEALGLWRSDPGLRESYERKVRKDALLRALARREGLSVDDAELRATLPRLCEWLGWELPAVRLGFEKEKELRAMLAEVLLRTKVLDKLMQQVTVKRWA